MATQIQLRRDNSANWASSNPVLGQGEEGLDLTVGHKKIGDGATVWLSLPYRIGAVSPGKSVGSSTVAGALTLTAAQLAACFFVDGAAQTAAFTLTTDTAANILAQLPAANVGSNFTCRIINNDQSATGYAASIAAGVGVTLETAPLAIPAIPKGGYVDLLFIFTDVTSGAAALSVYAVGGNSAALL